MKHLFWFLLISWFVLACASTREDTIPPRRNAPIGEGEFYARYMPDTLRDSFVVYECVIWPRCKHAMEQIKIESGHMRHSDSHPLMIAGFQIKEKEKYLVTRVMRYVYRKETDSTFSMTCYQSLGVDEYPNERFGLLRQAGEADKDYWEWTFRFRNEYDDDDYYRNWKKLGFRLEHDFDNFCMVHHFPYGKWRFIRHHRDKPIGSQIRLEDLLYYFYFNAQTTPPSASWHAAPEVCEGSLTPVGASEDFRLEYWHRYALIVAPPGKPADLYHAYPMTWDYYMEYCVSERSRKFKKEYMRDEHLMMRGFPRSLSFTGSSAGDVSSKLLLFQEMMDINLDQEQHEPCVPSPIRHWWSNY